MYFQRRELPSSISINLQELSSRLHKPRVFTSMPSSLFQFCLFMKKTEKTFKLTKFWDVCSGENQNRIILSIIDLPNGIRSISLLSYLIVTVTIVTSHF